MKISTSEEQTAVWKSIPGFAKIIMLLQAGIIFFLSFWIYEEYLNNLYLQSYINSLMQGSSFTIIATGSVGFFSIIVVSLYVRLHRTTRELHEILSVEASGLPGAIPSGFMDRHTEEHLIELIRKKNQAENLGTTSSMPVLKRIDKDSPK